MMTRVASAVKDRVAVTVPNELSLELVGPAGNILWTTPATAAARKSGDPPRR